MAVQMGRRLVWLSVIILLLLSALGGRLYTLEVARSARYTEVAYQSQTESVSLGLGRGQILDRNGVPLTDPQSVWGVAVFPSLLPPDPSGGQVQAEGTALAAALGLPADQVGQRLEAAALGLPAGPAGKRQPPTGATWLTLAAGGDPLILTAAQRSAVQELGLPGVVAWPRVQRYGDGALARQLVGYVNSSGGVLGLEQTFNAQLTGAAAPALTAFRDGRGEPLGGQAIRMMAPTAGKQPYDVVTTIDGQIQQAVERVLDAHDPKGGSTAVVLDPATGEVLAMASRPQFTYGQGPTDAERANRAVKAGHPGSVFKAITAAAALEQQRVRPDERFSCSKVLDFGGSSPKKAGDPPVTMTFRDAMAESCNDVFLQVGAKRLGVASMLAFARRFGFDAPALGGTLAEEDPVLPKPDDESAVQMAFGQGTLQVTPLQIARAYAAIAGGGVMPPVRLVKAVKSPAGEVMERPPAGQGKRVISEETAATLQDLLRGVTEPGGKGTGTAAWIAGVGSAGKTGTAEVDPTRPDDWDAWFAGYLPLRRPRYVVVVRVEDGGYGGSVAAPIFREIGQAILAIKGY